MNNLRKYLRDMVQPVCIGKFMPAKTIPVIGNFTYDSNWGKTITVPTEWFKTFKIE